jgi:GntR family transcriptional regulator
MPEDHQLRMRPVRDRRPLSVQVYDRLVEALRKQSRPGDQIPPEVELSAELGVSRTVLREALRLLEEDGVIERGTDPRRRQIARPSSRPPSFNAPIEEMLQARAPLEVKVIRTETIAATSWSRALLELTGEDERLVCRESLILADGEPVVSALEMVPADSGNIPMHLVAQDAEGSDRTLLAALGPQFRSKCVPTLWRIVAGSSVGSRSGFDKVRSDCHITNLTTVLSRQGKPVFLAKHLLRLDLVALSVGEPPDGIEPGTLDAP